MDQENVPGSPDIPTRAEPARRLAVVACMDARLDVYRPLDLQPGDAHVIRNAGGIVTDDVIRSLCLSQRLLGTTKIVLVHHTDCGLDGLDEPGFLTEVATDAGQTPPWSVGAFTDPAESVRRSMARLRDCPFLPERGHIRGFVYSVTTGQLDEVKPVT